MSQPHPLALYRAAVQHPHAEVEFMLRTFAATHDGELPTTLREDFAGTSAVAAAWVACDPQHQAVAIERDEPTARWAWQEARRQLGHRADDLHLLALDVADVTTDQVPPVDVICALNFSVLVHHDRDALVGYFAHARDGLVEDGMLVIDVYGGEGAESTGSQLRRVEPAGGEAPAFTYAWEQRRFDRRSRRAVNAIHFELDDGKVIRDAFVYDWRLWRPDQLRDAMLAAGFVDATLWCDPLDEQTGQSTGMYEPMVAVDDRHDYVAYVVGCKGQGEDIYP